MTPIWRHVATMATKLDPPIHVNHMVVHTSFSVMLEHVNQVWFTENWRLQLFCLVKDCEPPVNHHLAHNKLNAPTFGDHYDALMVVPVLFLSTWVERATFLFMFLDVTETGNEPSQPTFQLTSLLIIHVCIFT